MIYFYSDGIVQYSGYDLSFSYVTYGKYWADVSVEPQAAQVLVARERVIINCGSMTFDWQAVLGYRQPLRI